MKAAADQLEKRERTIARLEAENSRLLEQFHTWLYNATQHGITIEQLNEPLETKQKNECSMSKVATELHGSQADERLAKKKYRLPRVWQQSAVVQN
ncbi:hypothetical protein QYZ42_09375 [Vibrio parahaemolyticus]|nr:hypothetical protein [Vibrio parahaemolyticus]